jgi:excisionase family DNA binding protein
MISKLLRGIEVAGTLNVSKAFAYRMMADGRIPTVKLGRSVRVRPEDLDGFIAESTSQEREHLLPSKPIYISQKSKSIHG